MTIWTDPPAPVPCFGALTSASTPVIALKSCIDAIPMKSMICMFVWATIETIWLAPWFACGFVAALRQAAFWLSSTPAPRTVSERLVMTITDTEPATPTFSASADARAELLTISAPNPRLLSRP